MPVSLCVYRYGAVITAVDRTHDIMKLIKRLAEAEDTLDSQADYPVAGLPLHLKDYQGKEGSPLRSDQLWCYQVMWMKGDAEDKPWYVESALSRKHALISPAHGRAKAAEAAAQQVGSKRERPGSLAESQDESRASKRQAFNAIEQALAEVIAESPAEEKEAETTSDQQPTVEATLSHSKQPSEETVKRDDSDRKAKELAKSDSDRTTTQAEATAAGENASSPQTPTRSKPDGHKPSSATGTKQQLPAQQTQTSSGGRGSQRKSSTSAAAADAIMADSTTSSGTTAKRAVDEKADGPSQTLAIATDSPAVPEASTVSDSTSTAVAETGKTPTTPIRHIPKKGGRLSKNVAGSPSPKAVPSRAKTTDTTSPSPTPTSTASSSATHPGGEAAVSTGRRESAAVVTEGESDTSALVGVEQTVVTESTSDTGPASTAEERPVDKVEEKSTKVQTSEPIPITSTHRENGTRRASTPSAPPSSLSSLSSPTTLKIALPPPVSLPPKTTRQRSRLSEGEKLQLELRTQRLGDSPMSGGESPALDWSQTGKGARTRGKGTPVGSPVEEAVDVQGAGRKRGRGSWGGTETVSAVESKEKGKEEVDNRAEAELDTVGNKSSKRRRRASTNN